MPPSDRSRRAEDKTSNSSKIPILRSRSSSLSRPGSRCSRPLSRTENKSPVNSESLVLSSSWDTRPKSDCLAAASERTVVRQNCESVVADGNRKAHQKSTVVSNCEHSESTFPVDNSHRNSLEGQILGPEMMSEYKNAASVLTETLDSDCRGGTVGDIDEEVGTASVEDHDQPTIGSVQASDGLSVDNRKTPASGRERRSCSLDRSKPCKVAR